MAETEGSQLSEQAGVFVKAGSQSHGIGKFDAGDLHAQRRIVYMEYLPQQVSQARDTVYKAYAGKGKMMRLFGIKYK